MTDVWMHPTPGFPGFDHAAGTEPLICVACSWHAPDGHNAGRGSFVTLPLNAMRCPVCGHRLDDMDGCDSCAADRDEAIRQATEGDDDE